MIHLLCLDCSVTESVAILSRGSLLDDTPGEASVKEPCSSHVRLYSTTSGTLWSSVLKADGPSAIVLKLRTDTVTSGQKPQSEAKKRASSENDRSERDGADTEVPAAVGDSRPPSNERAACNKKSIGKDDKVAAAGKQKPKVKKRRSSNSEDCGTHAAGNTKILPVAGGDDLPLNQQGARKKPSADKDGAVARGVEPQFKLKKRRKEGRGSGDGVHTEISVGDKSAGLSSNQPSECKKLTSDKAGSVVPAEKQWSKASGHTSSANKSHDAGDSSNAEVTASGKDSESRSGASQPLEHPKFLCDKTGSVVPTKKQHLKVRGHSSSGNKSRDTADSGDAFKMSVSGRDSEMISSPPHQHKGLTNIDSSRVTDQMSKPKKRGGTKVKPVVKAASLPLDPQDCRKSSSNEDGSAQSKHKAESSAKKHVSSSSAVHGTGDSTDTTISKILNSDKTPENSHMSSNSTGHDTGNNSNAKIAGIGKESDLPLPHEHRKLTVTDGGHVRKQMSEVKHASSHSKEHGASVVAKGAGFPLNASDSRKPSSNIDGNGQKTHSKVKPHIRSVSAEHGTGDGASAVIRIIPYVDKSADLPLNLLAECKNSSTDSGRTERPKILGHELESGLREESQLSGATSLSEDLKHSEASENQSKSLITAWEKADCGTKMTTGSTSDRHPDESLQYEYRFHNVCPSDPRLTARRQQNYVGIYAAANLVSHSSRHHKSRHHQRHSSDRVKLHIDSATVEKPKHKAPSVRADDSANHHRRRSESLQQQKHVGKSLEHRVDSPAVCSTDAEPAVKPKSNVLSLAEYKKRKSDPRPTAVSSTTPTELTQGDPYYMTSSLAEQLIISYTKHNTPEGRELPSSSATQNDQVVSDQLGPLVVSKWQPGYGQNVDETIKSGSMCSSDLLPEVGFAQKTDGSFEMRSDDLVETGTASGLNHLGTQKTDGSFEMRSDDLVQTVRASDLDHHGTQKTDGSFETRSDDLVQTVRASDLDHRGTQKTDGSFETRSDDLVETVRASDLDHQGTQKTDGSFEMRSDDLVETVRASGLDHHGTQKTDGSFEMRSDDLETVPPSSLDHHGTQTTDGSFEMTADDLEEVVPDSDPDDHHSSEKTGGLFAIRVGDLLETVIGSDRDRSNNHKSTTQKDADKSENVVKCTSDIGLLPTMRSYEVTTKLHKTVPLNSEALAEVAEQPENFTDTAKNFAATVKQKEQMFASDENENSSEPEEDSGLKSNMSLVLKKLDSDVNACSEPLVTSVSSSDAAAEVSLKDSQSDSTVTFSTSASVTDLDSAMETQTASPCVVDNLKRTAGSDNVQDLLNKTKSLVVKATSLVGKAEQDATKMQTVMDSAPEQANVSEGSSPGISSIYTLNFCLFTLFLPEHDYVTFGFLLSQIRLSSVTFMRPTQGDSGS